MAKNNLILAGFFLLVLLFSYGITFTEERVLLKAVKLDESGNLHVKNTMINRKTNLNRDILEEASAGNGTDDYRSTTPGHSPGVGHSNGPASNDNN
ncbi:hypothetical protein PTKIN_Ptkin09bG0131800 [Pterospermum kingtungense]